MRTARNLSPGHDFRYQNLFPTRGADAGLCLCLARGRTVSLYSRVKHDEACERAFVD